MVCCFQPRFRPPTVENPPSRGVQRLLAADEVVRPGGVFGVDEHGGRAGQRLAVVADENAGHGNGAAVLLGELDISPLRYEEGPRAGEATRGLRVERTFNVEHGVQGVLCFDLDTARLELQGSEAMKFRKKSVKEAFRATEHETKLVTLFCLGMEMQPAGRAWCVCPRHGAYVRASRRCTLIAILSCIPGGFAASGVVLPRR